MDIKLKNNDPINDNSIKSDSSDNPPSVKQKSGSTWVLLLLAVCCFGMLIGFDSTRNELYSYTYYSLWHSVYVQITPVYLSLMILSALCLLLPPYKRLRKRSILVAKCPAEIALSAALLLLLVTPSPVADLCYSYYSISDPPVLIFSFLIFMLLFSIWFLAVMVLLQITDMGFITFLHEKSFVFRNGRRFLQQITHTWKKLLTSLKTADFSDRSYLWLLKLVIVNFLILFVCCLFWFWGVFGLIIYSAILFFLLKKNWDKVRRDYHILLNATQQMAEGNLHMNITEELGLFEPFKEELAKINLGFRKAVEEETRSQNMKTELITNVSHDLKTPLTAIITYINLLKEETLTPQERREYIDILDRKSLRLKKLIEDLFEVSKAASGNITIEKSQVDLAELVRQAVSEQEDRLREVSIDCRVKTPEGHVFVMLDSEKTYRILENLLGNVAKYALAGTRAWVQLDAEQEEVTVTIKNVSAAELDMENPQSLTERFVRGDKSRNTEGSGLGLAIVKNFTELQGGHFEISTDGDLFKAIVRFPV